MAILGGKKGPPADDKSGKGDKSENVTWQTAEQLREKNRKDEQDRKEFNEKYGVGKKDDAGEGTTNGEGSA